MTDALDKLDRLDELDLRPIPGHFPYAADSNGNIWNTQNKWRSTEPRILSHSMHDGYKRVRLRSGKNYLFRFAHVLVCAAFHGNRPKEYNETRHLNGNRLDNRPENLKWGTTKENYLDRVKHGTDKFQYRDTHNRFKTECKFGHPYNEQNTYKNKQGRRFCRTCRNIKGAVYYKINKEKVIARQLSRYHCLKARGIDVGGGE